MIHSPTYKLIRNIMNIRNCPSRNVKEKWQKLGHVIVMYSLVLEAH